MSTPGAARSTSRCSRWRAARGRFANLIPLGGIESTRLLDVIEERLATGRSSPSLSALLARAGIRYVVARNDLDWRRTGSPRPARCTAC